MPNNSPQLQAGRLPLIRIALTLGVIVFTIVLYIARKSEPAPMPELASSNLRVVLPALTAVIAAVILALRMRIAGLQGAARAQLTIIAWTLGEMAALAGLLFYFQTGVERLAAPGLLTFVMGMLVVRPPAN